MREKFGRREFLKHISGTVCTVGATLWTFDVEAQEKSAETDPYAHYVRTSQDFRRVKQDRRWTAKAFPAWLSMPWTYQWTIGYTEASAQWSKAHGYNGSFLDGNSGSPDSPPGKLDWINRNHFPFYLDHTAGKGDLHLWDGGKQKPHLAELHGSGIRTIPLNAKMQERLRQRIKTNLAQVKSSPYRAAYALDDEASWGHFVHPTMWCVTDDTAAYKTWLNEIYGKVNAPVRERWITYEDIRPKLGTWSVREFDASPLMDQWSFNDSYWCNFLGGLVEYANSVDPNTPCGIVGGQAPNAFGGYDYAKLTRKLQFIEAYNLGSSQAIIRSFNPHLAIPAVTSQFHQSADDDIYQIWYYLAHGNRGHIGWVENWFEGEKPNAWHEQVAPHQRDAQKIAPLLQDAEWMHNGIALYYSHPSIQLGWILDAAAHGKTWVNRDGDHRLGASHLVRHAWENMLRDSGLQYNFLSYVDVIQQGIPAEYRVLILPACLCLSDAEASAIEAFCRRGGLVIADYLPGLWDQHGKGRKQGGVLDALFGVSHKPDMTAADVFGTNSLWCEVDQDANYNRKTYTEFLTHANTCVKDASGFHQAVRTLPTNTVKKVGSGTAVLLNLSPQWYNAYRTEGFASAKRRDVFLRSILQSGIKRWVEIENADPQSFGYEITCFRKADGRKVLFLCSNPEINGSETGGGNAAELKTDTITLTLAFASPITNVRDERRGIELKSGTRLPLQWKRNEALVLSFD